MDRYGYHAIIQIYVDTLVTNSCTAGSLPQIKFLNLKTKEFNKKYSSEQKI